MWRAILVRCRSHYCSPSTVVMTYVTLSSAKSAGVHLLTLDQGEGKEWGITETLDIIDAISRTSQGSGEWYDWGPGGIPREYKLGFFVQLLNRARFSTLLLLFWMNWVDHPGQKVVRP